MPSAWMQPRGGKIVYAVDLDEAVGGALDALARGTGLYLAVAVGVNLEARAVVRFQKLADQHADSVIVEVRRDVADVDFLAPPWGVLEMPFAPTTQRSRAAALRRCSARP